MPIRRYRTTRRTTRRRTLRGRGLWDKMKKWATNAHNYVKEKKLISSTLGRLGFNKAGSIAGQLGYGRRRRRTMRSRRVGKTLQRGRGLWDKVKNWASSAHKYVRDNKIASKLLRTFGKDNWANTVAQHGYGRRRRTTRRLRGRGFFGDLWNGVKTITGYVAKPLAEYGIKRLTGGRRRRRTLRGRGQWGGISMYATDWWKQRQADINNRVQQRFGRPKIQAIAGSGRRRRRMYGRRVGRTRQRGRGVFGSILGNLLPF